MESKYVLDQPIKNGADLTCAVPALQLNGKYNVKLDFRLTPSVLLALATNVAYVAVLENSARMPSTFSI